MYRSAAIEADPSMIKDSLLIHDDDDVTYVYDDVMYVYDDVTYVYDDVTYVYDDVTYVKGLAADTR